MRFPPGLPLCAVCGKAVNRVRSYGLDRSDGCMVFTAHCHGAVQIVRTPLKEFQVGPFTIRWASAFAGQAGRGGQVDVTV